MHFASTHFESSLRLYFRRLSYHVEGLPVQGTEPKKHQQKCRGGLVSQRTLVSLHRLNFTAVLYTSSWLPRVTVLI